MRKRKLRSISAALTVAAGSLAAGAVAPQPAGALTAPVAITADNLPTWQTNGIVFAMAQANGTVFAGGTFSSVRPSGEAAGGAGEQEAVNFAAFDAATGAPTDCKLSFTVGSGTATVRALAVSPDGTTLYAGGFFGAVNGTPVSSLAAIDIATCAVKSGFGVSVNATVRALAVSGDTVYLGGDFSSVGGQPRSDFAAVSTSGAVTPFTADGDAPGRALALTPDGSKAILGGDFDRVNGTASHALAVVDAGTGAVVKGYGSSFIPSTSVVKDIATDATGFYTGNEGTGGGVFDGRIAINLSDLNQRWRDTCLGATQSVEVYKTVLYSGSHAHDCSTMNEYPNQRRKHLLAQGVDNPAKLGWFPDTNDGLGEGIGPRAMSLASSGGTDYLWVGGEFTTVNGVAQQGLTRFASGPDTGVPTTPNVSVSSVTPGSVAVRVQTSLDLDDSSLTYRVYKNGGATPVYTTTASSLPWVRPQFTWTDTDVTAGATYTYRVTASDGTNTTVKSPTQTVTAATVPEAYPTQVLADGATLYWRYNETANTFVADNSPADDGGNHVGGPTRGVSPGALTGSASTAVTYNGTTQWSYSDAKHSRPSSYSIETWFRTTTTAGGKLVGFGDRTSEISATTDKHVYMTNAGRLIFGVRSGSNRTVTTSAAYNDGQWHHVVATQGSTGMRLFVDGALQASSPFTTGGTDYTGYWHVGGDNLSGWTSRPTSNYFAGSLDETAIYPSVLSPAQIALHYSLGTNG
ncbi:LamG domain-containing protein [Streptomyces sp. MI02-7b]|uniref:LamG domain-containing protein n=1 Tax=Streptomyces sp. MI02-7b TaxID=462941 RepID=UPI0029A2AF56|nr:LamG-like jellyroll fold domain-containing protein [Streptomyces sp. MI02-7b]MDX3075371.1 LamG domain-containing protein [Streptomyces sp. MI02-7b]